MLNKLNYFKFTTDWIMHLLIAIIYTGIISTINPSLLSSILPLILGTFLIDIIDHPVFVYLTNRNQSTSIQIRKLISKGLIIKTFRFWADNHKEENKLIIHSILGQPILVLMLFYFQFHNSNSFLFFLILGMFLHILVDQTSDLKTINHLKNWFFWPIEKRINNSIVIIYCLFMIFTSIFFSIKMFYS